MNKYQLVIHTNNYYLGNWFDWIVKCFTPSFYLVIICCTHCIISWIYFIRIVIDVLITYFEGLFLRFYMVWWNSGARTVRCLRRLIKSRSIFETRADMKTVWWAELIQFQGKCKDTLLHRLNVRIDIKHIMYSLFSLTRIKVL